jgi:hypothetical protein
MAHEGGMFGALAVGKTYVVGSLSNVAEGWGRSLENELFGHVEG